MYLVFYEGNEIRGQGFYSNDKHIPDQHLHLETTEELIKSGYPLEIYEELGKKKVRINKVEKEKNDIEKVKIETIKTKVKADEDITNKELAYLLINKDNL